MIRPPRPLTMNPNYLAVVRGVRELHRLSVAGKDDSPEADAIRDATDGPWESLSEVERRRVRNLSEDLYSLVESPPITQPKNPQVQAKLSEALEARQRGEWDRALDLLRRWRANIDPALLSHVRGSIWREAGDPATAVLFYEHAANLEPDNGNYQAMFLDVLNITEPGAARKRAEEILQRHQQFSPDAVSRAADITFMSARTSTEAEAIDVFKRLEPILGSTLDRIKQDERNELDHLSCVTILALLGFGNEFLGKTQSAVAFYSQALQIEPDNDALLVARGRLLYGTSALAIKDLEMARDLGSSLIWPYVFLAHHNLQSGSFDDCRKLCERVLNMNGSAAVMSEVSEWMAIAQAELGFPVEIVHASFENAIRFDSSNDRARGNLEKFKAASKPVTVDVFEVRTAGSLRNSGLAEQRFLTAA